MKRDADVALQVEELPDGVRYVLPRRRRRGWAALLWHAIVAFFFYLTVPAFLVWLVVDQNASSWFLVIGVGAILLFLIGGLRNIRNAMGILATPDVSIELRTGRIIVIRRTLLGTTIHEVPLSEARRLSVRCLSAEDALSKPAQGAPKSFWRRWFGTHFLEQGDRAERRKEDVLRFFGSLVLEGEGGAEIAFAEEFGRSYLTRLAEDLAQRINRDEPMVTVEQRGPWPAAIAADDPRLNRPGQITNIKTDRTGDGFIFQVPPPGVSYAPVVGGVVFGGLAICMASWLAQTLSWQAGSANLCVLFFMACMLATGIGAARTGLKAALFGLTRTVIVTNASRLTVRFEGPIGRRTRAWPPAEAAACLIEEWATKERTGKAVLVYDLIVLDQAMRGFTVLRARPEAELEWIAAVIHKELGLGDAAPPPSSVMEAAG